MVAAASPTSSPLVSLSATDNETPFTSSDSISPTCAAPTPLTTASPKPLLSHSISAEQLKHLTFHAKYATRFEGEDVILRFSTKTCFYASLKSLIAYSNFFSNMVSLPETHSDSTIIDLPSATSDGLVCLISLISSHHASDWITDLPQGDKDTLHRTMNGIFTFIDAYDATGLLSLLASHFDHHDELRFLIACVGGVEASAVALSKDLFKLGPLDKTINRLLTRFAPEYARRWESLQASKSTAWGRCQHLMLDGQPIEGCGNNFGKKCRSGGGCTGMEIGKQSMKRLRYHTALIAIEAIKDANEQGAAIVACRMAVTGKVHCQNCSTRLSTTFRHAIRNSGYLSEISI